VLYLDSSVLIKHYQIERGTEAFNEKLRSELESSRAVFTSVLSYAEIHAIIARRVREKLVSSAEGSTIQTSFDSDWLTGFTSIPMDPAVLSFIRQIVNVHPLKGSEAVHLASALSLRDRVSHGSIARPSEPITFASSDRQLISASQKLQLEVFNPEDQG
jgi:uncharacterized protein